MRRRAAAGGADINFSDPSATMMDDSEARTADGSADSDLSMSAASHVASPNATPATPATVCDRANPLPFMRQLRADFSGEFLVMLFCTYFGTKGALSTIADRVQIPFYRDYLKTSASDYQKYTTFATTPWALKALYGAVSDTIPIRGYHKTPYMFAATVLGVVAYVGLLMLPVVGDEGGGTAAANTTLVPVAVERPAASSVVVLAPVLFALANMQIAVVDILTEGRYAAMMVAKPHTGSSLVTWVWACIFIGSLVASGFIGPVADSYGVPALFVAAIPFALQLVVPLCLGYMKEVRDASGETKRAGDGEVHGDATSAAPPRRTSCIPHIKTGKLRAQWRMYALAALMTTAALCNSISSLFLKSETTSLLVTWAWCLSIIVTSFWALSRPMACAVTYMFLSNALYVRIPGALDSWYTREEGCVPDGPAFDNTYYLTYSGLVGSVAALAGVSLFQLFFKNSTFRRAFWMTTVMKLVASMFDYVIVKRWHRPHVSDKVMFIFGDAIIGETVFQLDFMPSVVLVSKMCPPGYESLVYAMLAGFQNFGYQVSRYTGLWLMEVFGVYAKPKPSTDCNWEGLPMLLLVSHLFLPLLTVPLTFVLLPDARLTECVLDAAAGAGPPTAFRRLENDAPSDGDDDAGGEVEMRRAPHGEASLV